MPSSKKTASVTAVVRTSLYESLLETLSSEHQALLSELGSARYPYLPPSLAPRAHTPLCLPARPPNRQETVRFERQVKHQFSEMNRIKQMVSGELATGLPSLCAAHAATRRLTPNGILFLWLCQSWRSATTPSGECSKRLMRWQRPLMSSAAGGSGRAPPK
jgi:hypothetical protein